MKKEIYNWLYMRRSNLMYHILKHNIKKKREKIISLSEKHGRGIGKTYNLVRLSDEFDIPLIVPTSMSMDYILKRFPQYKPNLILKDKWRSMHIGSIILIDELQGFDPYVQKYLKRFTRIGFETR